MPRIEGVLIFPLMGHRVRTVNVSDEKHLSGLTGVVVEIKPQLFHKGGKPVECLKYTHSVRFDDPLPGGLTGAWFTPDELEDLGDGEA